MIEILNALSSLLEEQQAQAVAILLVTRCQPWIFIGPASRI